MPAKSALIANLREYYGLQYLLYSSGVGEIKYFRSTDGSIHTAYIYRRDKDSFLIKGSKIHEELIEPLKQQGYAFYHTEGGARETSRRIGLSLEAIGSRLFYPSAD